MSNTMIRNRLNGVTIVQADDCIELTCPYNGSTVIKCRNWGGRWDKTKKMWLIPSRYWNNVLTWFNFTPEAKND